MSDNSAFSNEFGSVYSDRIAFNVKKGWFGGGSSEDLPIRHITSVKSETTRRPILGIVLALVGLAAFTAGGGAIVVALFLLALGLLLLIGWPTVTINTAGNDLRKATGGIWQKTTAEEFVSAVKKALFAKA